MRCNICGNEHPEAEHKFIDDRLYCPSCYKDNVYVCPICNEPHRKARGNIGRMDLNGTYGEVRICPHCRENKVIKCEGCGEFVFEDKIKNLQGYYFCEDCYEQKAVPCDSCGKMMLKDRGYHAGEKHICSECYENAYFTCNDCGEVHSTDDSYDTSGGLICGNCITEYTECVQCQTFQRTTSMEDGQDGLICTSCFNRTSFRCYNCDDVFAIGDVHDDRDGRHHCEACATEKGILAMYRVSRYEEKDSNYKEIPYKYTYGVELETCNMPSKRFTAPFQQVRDGSITGMEYVSPILYGDYGADIIRTFCKDATASGLAVDDRCGYHLHVGAQTLPWDKIVNITKLYYFVEPLIYAMNPERRRGTLEDNSCGKPAPVSPEYVDAESYVKFKRKYYGFGSDVSEERIREYAHSKYQSQRYRGVNLHSLWHRGTIEFRYMSATLNADKVLGWIRFHLMLIEYGAKEDLTEFINSIESKQFKNVLSHVQVVFDSLKMIIDWSKYKNKKELTDFIIERVYKFNAHYDLGAKKIVKKNVSPVEISKKDSIFTTWAETTRDLVIERR